MIAMLQLGRTDQHYKTMYATQARTRGTYANTYSLFPFTWGMTSLLLHWDKDAMILYSSWITNCFDICCCIHIIIKGIKIRITMSCWQRYLISALITDQLPLHLMSSLHIHKLTRLLVQSLYTSTVFAWQSHNSAFSQTFFWNMPPDQNTQWALRKAWSNVDP